MVQKMDSYVETTMHFLSDCQECQWTCELLHESEEEKKKKKIVESVLDSKGCNLPCNVQETAETIDPTKFLPRLLPTKPLQHSPLLFQTRV